MSAGRQFYGAGTVAYLATLPSLQIDSLPFECLRGSKKLVEWYALHIPRLVDTQVEVSVADNEVAHVGHHAHHTTEVFLGLHVDDGDTAVVAHTSHKQVFVIGGEHGAPQAISALVVTVYRFCETVIERQHIVDDEQ